MSRPQLYALGLLRGEIRAEIRAGRWHRWGRQTVLIELTDATTAHRWRAIFETSPTAVLDGVSALQIAGLRGVDMDEIHVAVPKSARPRRCRGVAVHETRRYEKASVLEDGIPRMKPATAAVHAALWAHTERQAAFFVIAAAQQGLFSTEELGEEISKVRRHRRRTGLRGLYADIVDGVEALGERDFARLCRKRGFPEPTRQFRRQTKTGDVYFDTVWEEFELTVEINGSQHDLDPEVWIKDALKQNLMSLDGHVVLRIPNLALRLDPEPFLDQIEAALVRKGWTAAARPDNAQQRRAGKPRPPRRRGWFRRPA